MKKADVIGLAKKEAEQDELVRGLGIMNVPTDPEKAVEAQARLRIETDKLYLYREGYRKAFDKWAAAGFPE